MRRPTRKTGMMFAACAMLVSALVFADVSAARQAELMSLLDQDCGACHGMTRQGGLGPALTRQALAGKSPIMLREVILNGRPGTPMPPWKQFISAQEADWLVQVLIQGRADAH